MAPLLINRLAKTFKRLAAMSKPMRRGDQGERVATAYLKQAGYQVLGKNLRTRFGEVDLLVQAPDGRTVVLVEVKTRAMTSPGKPDQTDPQRLTTAPEVRVGQRKRTRLVALAGQLARRHGLTQRPIRFDVVGVDLPPNGKRPTVRHHVGAFESHV